MAAILAYTPDQLLALRPQVRGQHLLPAVTVERIRALGIRRRARGCRAGRNVQRAIGISESSRDSDCKQQQHQPKQLLQTARAPMLVGIPRQPSTGRNGKDMCVGYLNCQSIGNKSASLTNIINEQHLDAFAVVETFHESSDDITLKRITPDGFICLDQAREKKRSARAATQKKGSSGAGANRPIGGGVAWICKESCKARRLDLDIKAKSFEFISVMLTLKGVKTIAVAVYRPGSERMSDQFLEEFSLMLEELIVYSCHILIVGDVNIHLDTVDDNWTMKFNTIMDCFGLVQNISTPTHKAGHTLDVVVTKSSGQLFSVKCDVHVPSVSDHSLIITRLPLAKPSPVSSNATCRAWKDFDRELFVQDLLSSELCSGDWTSLTPDDMASLYNEVLTELVDKHAPIRSTRKHYRPITPWFNPACGEQKRKARCYERIYRRTKLNTDRDRWLAQLRACQEFYRKTQDLYWQTRITESAGNAKKLWNELSAVRGKNRSPTFQDSLTAEQFLKSFEKKVADVRSSTLGSEPPEFSNFSGECFSKFAALSEDDVCELIMKSPNKSCGLDPAPTWLIKDFSKILSPYITELFNKSLSSGHFPVPFRVAEVTPILKKPSLDPTLPINYRPVSNLQFISKVLERAVNKQIVLHLDGNSLLPEHQSAYRKCHSTETALLKVTSDALIAADQGMITVLGMLDLSAAFDCVDHQIFVTRMELTFGINSVALGWITSYLDGRRQRVRYNGALSSWSLVDCGVPQGSILGPLFFLAYTSDVFDIASRHGLKIHGYADDLQIYDHCTVRDIDLLVNRLSTCITEIMDWMTCNRLKLNASKTEVILLGSSRRLINCTRDQVDIDGNSINFADKVRNLGVLVDSALTFNQHVSKLVSSSYYHLRQMRSIRKSLTFDSAHALARALVLSRLDYCNGLLCGIPDFLMKQLDGVMRAAARLILQLPRSGHVTKAMHDRLQWMDMRARIEFKLCVTAYRCLHGLAPSYLSRLCIPVSELPGRSHLRSATSGKLLVPSCKTKTIGPRAFAVSCPTAWNNLPIELTDPANGCSLPTFKKKLKTHFLTQMSTRH